MQLVSTGITDTPFGLSVLIVKQYTGYTYSNMSHAEMNLLPLKGRFEISTLHPSFFYSSVGREMARKTEEFVIEELLLLAVDLKMDL